MIKVLHTADIHLDVPFKIASVAKAQTRRSELRGALSSLFTFARLEHFDLMLIAGDMFDREFATPDTVALVLREMAACSDCRIVISPGNHDPYTPGSVWAKSEFPDNVYIFRSPTLERISFDDIGVDVYGYAFTGPYMDACPFSEPPELDPSRINILCGHGCIGGSSRHCPITADDISRSGFDYIALGHIHNSDGIKRVGRTWYGYPGALEGHDFSEPGFGGAVVATMRKDGGVFDCDARGRRFSRRRFETLTVDASAVRTDTDLLALIDGKIAAHGYGEETQLRLVLTGFLSSAVALSESAVLDHISPSLFYAELVMNTEPLPEGDGLDLDPTVRGAFYASLRPELESDDPELRRTASDALRYGLSALRGDNIL